MPWPGSIRPSTRADAPFLETMLYEAFFWNPRRAREPFERFSRTPNFRKIIGGWGERPGDTGVIALDSAGVPAGAAWCRYFSADDHFHGFVDEETPELSIAGRADVRGRGVGTAVLEGLLATARAQGVAQISLSVEPENPALRLYERFGFRKVGESGTAWTMLRACAPGDSGTSTPG